MHTSKKRRAICINYEWKSKKAKCLSLMNFFSDVHQNSSINSCYLQKIVTIPKRACKNFTELKKYDSTIFSFNTESTSRCSTWNHLICTRSTRWCHVWHKKSLSDMPQKTMSYRTWHRFQCSPKNNFFAEIIFNDSLTMLLLNKFI